MTTLQDGQESAAPPALAEEQRPRLILHIDLDRVLYFRPLCGERGVEGWINRCLSETVWGTLDPQTGDWVLASPVPSLSPPKDDDRLITYSTFLQLHRFPGIAEAAEEAPERQEMASMLETITQKKQPGEKAKAAGDAFLKGLMVPLNLRKAMDIEKVDFTSYPLAEREGEEEGREAEPIRDYVSRIKTGVWSLLPGFWTLLVQLVKDKRDFAIVLHSSEEAHREPDEQETTGDSTKTPEAVALYWLEAAANELQAFCEGRHPCFDGNNRTKLVKFNGEKGARDLQLPSHRLGYMDTSHRPPSPLEDQPAGDADQDVAEEEEAEEEEDGNGDEGEKTAGEAQEAAEATEEKGATEETIPLKISFKNANVTFRGLHEGYVGLVHQLLGRPPSGAVMKEEEQSQYLYSGNAVGLVDKGPVRLMLVDRGDPTSHHIFVLADDPVGGSLSRPFIPLKIRDVVKGELLSNEDEFGHRIIVLDPVQMISEPDTLYKAIRAADAERMRRINAAREATAKPVEDTTAPSTEATAEELRPRRLTHEELRALPAREYLHATVLPVLTPALEVVQRDRPPNPVHAVAMYLLQHKDGYNVMHSLHARQQN